MPPFDVNVSKLIEQIERDLPDGSPLDKVTEAQQRSRLLTEVGDQLVDHFVTAARAAGGSWSHVGDALGVSKQAAQQRWVPSIFQRFTDRSRQVIVVAQERARSLRHDAIAPTHMVLALLESDGLAARILADAGVTGDSLAKALGDAIAPGTARTPAQMPLAMSTKRALDSAATNAAGLGHDFVGTEHVLLGLFASGDAAVSQAFARLGLVEDDVRAEVARRVAAFTPGE